MFTLYEILFFFLKKEEEIILFLFFINTTVALTMKQRSGFLVDYKKSILPGFLFLFG